MNSEKSEVGLSKWDGTISPDKFQQGALAFAEKWKTVCVAHDHDLPNWSWVSCLNPHFLNLHQVILLPSQFLVNYCFHDC